MSEMELLVKVLSKNNLSIAACESLTGGLFTSSIVNISGASKVLKGSLVTYANEMKVKLAHVDAHLIRTFGVVSGEVAKAMAENVAMICESSIGVSFTGNAGPDTLEGKKAGLVYSAIAYNGNILVFCDELGGNREMIRENIVLLMCKRILEII